MIKNGSENKGIGTFHFYLFESAFPVSLMYMLH